MDTYIFQPKVRSHILAFLTAWATPDSVSLTLTHSPRNCTCSDSIGSLLPTWSNVNSNSIAPDRCVSMPGLYTCDSEDTKVCVDSSCDPLTDCQTCTTTATQPPDSSTQPTFTEPELTQTTAQVTSQATVPATVATTVTSITTTQLTTFSTDDSGSEFYLLLNDLASVVNKYFL